MSLPAAPTLLDLASEVPEHLSTTFYWPTSHEDQPRFQERGLSPSSCWGETKSHRRPRGMRDTVEAIFEQQNLPGSSG